MEGSIQQGNRTLDVGNGVTRSVQLSLDSLGQIVIADQEGIRGVGETEPDAINAAIVAIQEGLFYPNSALFFEDGNA